MLKEGDQAPEIDLETDTGENFRLSDLRGRRVVLYFYPKADTPGCTTESCEFRDHLPAIQEKGAAVIGISPDKVAPQAKFKEKYGLTFPLLADYEKKAAQAYGVWKEKNMYGKKTMGIERTTFVIDAAGKIEKIYSKVRAQGHAAKILEDL